MVGPVTYHHEVILAMELNRSHIGKLVQLITDSWSMTGTLTRVDQHDNREWEVAYPSRRLVPVRGEIYATLHIGPWVGDVIGNQPVTVETVAGTLEAPETAAKAIPNLITPEESAEARAVVQGAVVEEAPVHRVDDILRSRTRCGLYCGRDSFTALDLGGVSGEDGDVTCRECLAWEEAPPLPPEPPADWHKR